MSRRMSWFGGSLALLVVAALLSACGTQPTSTNGAASPQEVPKATAEQPATPTETPKTTPTQPTAPATGSTKPTEELPKAEAPKTVAAASNDAQLAAKGKLVFVQVGCKTCHMNPATGNMYPDLRGLYGSQRKLKDGSTVVADEEYLRESIVNPNAKLVAGYAPVMPPYNYLKEEQVQQLVAYIKSLKDEKPEYVKQ